MGQGPRKNVRREKGRGLARNGPRRQEPSNHGKRSERGWAPRRSLAAVALGGRGGQPRRRRAGWRRRRPRAVAAGGGRAQHRGALGQDSSLGPLRPVPARWKRPGFAESQTMQTSAQNASKTQHVCSETQHCCFEQM